jgi:hypothetical protein
MAGNPRLGVFGGREACNGCGLSFRDHDLDAERSAGLADHAIRGAGVWMRPFHLLDHLFSDPDVAFKGKRRLFKGLCAG